MSARRIGVATFVVTGVAAACLFVGFLLGKFSERAPQPAGQAAKREQTADRENVRGNDRGLEPADPSLPRADNYRATWAVIIGVDNYPVGGSDLKKLSYAVNDAREFRNLLRDEFGFADERTLFLSDNDATHEAIRAAFTAWLPQQQPQADDAILIFFAGHGLIDSQTDAGYLAGVDSHSQKLDATCVPVASIKQWLTAFPCKHKALILDSCYSGSLFEKTAVPAAITVAATAASPTTSVAATAGGGPNRSGDTRGPASPLSLTPVGNNLAYYLRQPAFFGMSAGRLQPVADGSAQDAHSIFTSTLLQVLKERADSTHPDHLFTFRHLAAQVEARVATAAGSHQTPNWGQLAPGDGDFVFRPTVKRQTPREVSAERYKQLQVRFAMNLIDQGVNELENGDPTRGFAMLGQAYHAAAEMPELRASTLALIGAYDFSLPTQLSYTGRVSVAAFSPDGRTILTGSPARLWDTATGRLLREFVPNKEGINAVAFSPDGQKVLTGSNDNTARLWDAKTGKPLGEVMQHYDAVRAVAFSPDGEMVLTGSWDKTARLWDAKTGRPLREPFRHESRVRSVAFSTDGQTFLTGNFDNTARLWNAKTGQPLGESLRHEVVVSPIMSLIKDVKAFGSVPHEEASPFQSVDPDGKKSESNSSKTVFVTGVIAAAFSPDGQTVITGSDDYTARLWDAKTGKPLGEPLRHDALLVFAVAYSHDGKTVLTASGNGARLWDAQTGKLLGEPLRHENSFRALALSPDGQTMLTGSDDAAQLWDAKSGKPLGEAIRHENHGVDVVTFSPDGQMVYTAGWDSRLRNVNSGKPIGMRLRHPLDVDAVAFSPDGQIVLTGSQDGTAWLWDAKTGKPVGEPLRIEYLGNVLSATPRNVAFSPDGRTVLTGSNDETARLWDVKTGKPLGEPLRHDGVVPKLAFSPDGQTVLTGSGNVARLWDAKTGKPLGRPMRHESEVHGVAFSPDGQTVLTGSYDGTAWLWPVPKGFPDNPGLVATYVAARSCWQEDSFGVLHRMTLEQQLATWDAASELGREWLQYRSDAAARDACLWHKLQAEEFEANKNWFATAFHLKYLVQNDPQDGDLRQRLATAKKMLEGQRQELEGQRQEAARLSEKKPSPPEKAP